MTLLLLLTQITGFGATNYSADTRLHVPARAPTFAEEFDGKRINRKNWRFDTSRNATGWNNHERQYYSDWRSDNARIEKGKLVIEARRRTALAKRLSDGAGQRYTSARLVYRQAFGFGFYEIRAKLPCGRGIWPAIWMLAPGGKWPDSGGIDIMEMVGWDPHVIHATLHSGAFNHAKGTQRGAQMRLPTTCSAFHRYQLQWTPQAITVGIDDRAFMRVTNDQPGGVAAWPFTKPYELILNVAVGGDWGGQKGIDDAAFPQAMLVDYVHHWASGS